MVDRTQFWTLLFLRIALYTQDINNLTTTAVNGLRRLAVPRLLLQGMRKRDRQKPVREREGRKHPSFRFPKQWTRQQSYRWNSKSTYMYIHLHVISHTIRRSVMKTCCLISFFICFFPVPVRFFLLYLFTSPHIHIWTTASLFSISTVCCAIWNRFVCNSRIRVVGLVVGAGTRMCL